MMSYQTLRFGMFAGTMGLLSAATTGCTDDDGGAEAADARRADGQAIFRFDTFGDERVWTDQLGMHQVISTAVSPMTALSVGLKVDAEALPPGTLETADLNAPATTVALIELDAVVGIKGTVENGVLVSVGVTCALCHSDVDDSVMAGIGKRLDGHHNPDLNPGAILALSPANAAAAATLGTWGPGFYDPRFNQDMISDPVRIPPIYGLDGVATETYTGDGSADTGYAPISYWNAYVGITQMGGQGEFSDPRIGVEVTLPAGTPDLITPKLPALLEYQLSLTPPAVDPSSFDAAMAASGEALFEGAAGCADCHAGERLTDAPALHAPAEVGTDPAYAARTATKMYRTTPLRALALHPPYFHDGSAATLLDVVNHYDTHMSLGLTDSQKAELVEYLKSL